MWLLVLLGSYQDLVSRQIVCLSLAEKRTDANFQTQRVRVRMNLSDLVNINHCDLSTQSGLAPCCSLVLPDAESETIYQVRANDLLRSDRKSKVHRVQEDGLRYFWRPGCTGTGF